MRRSRGVVDWLTRRWRQSLVLSITAMGVAAVALVGVLAAAVVGDQIREDALARARATADVLARSTFAPRVPADGRRLDDASARMLDNQFQSAQAAQPGISAVLRSADGRLLYSSSGAVPAGERDVTRTGTSVVRAGGERRVRSILPVRTRAGTEAVAYLQLDVPYAPVARDIDRRTRRLNVVLAIAALALYLLMLPTLIRAGRAVRAQYDPRKLELARDVKRAIKHGDLDLAYQPIVDGRGGLRSVEALVRWTDPRRGPISPATFIPALESTPAIWEFTLHVFEKAFAQCATWCAEGREIRIAVNVSGAVMLDRRLIPSLQRLAREHSITPTMIEIEITEGALVQDPRAATKVLETIADMGLSVIAIDDFGTGYSSLARLHELPLNTLKIDQSFVKRMADDGNGAVVRSVIELAHALDMDVIAEGVEDAETAERLVELGAECLQGYHFARPMPAADLLEWLPAKAAVA